LNGHERLTEMKVRLLGDLVARRTAWKLAREHGWDSTFEAEYIAVCKLQADAFISIDPEMVAKAAPIVAVAELADRTRSGSRSAKGAVMLPPLERMSGGNLFPLE
jgi:hypothetical protein